VVELRKIVVIHDLKRQGLSVSAIARQTGLDRKTARKYLDRGLEIPVYGPRGPQSAPAGKVAEASFYLFAGSVHSNPHPPVNMHNQTHTCMIRKLRNSRTTNYFDEHRHGTPDPGP
jgi:hypothetical protein